MGFSPLAIKYYGTILISDLEGKFQQGFYYELGVPTIHLTPKKHMHTVGSRSINDSTECDNHEHSHSEFVYLKLTGSMRIVSRSTNEGEEIQDEENEANYCPLCGSTEIYDHTCFACNASFVYCDDCGKLKGQCVCLPSMTACGVCGMYYCICFEPCEECGSYPCVCDELIGGGNNSGGDNLGGGGSGGGSNPGNNSDTGGGDGSEPLSCKNLEEVLQYIPPRLALKGIYLNNIQIVETEVCSNIASASHANNWIKICSQHFYDFPIEDQTSIIYHEYYHLTYDIEKRDDWSPWRKALSSFYYFPTPPDLAMPFYIERDLLAYNSLPSNEREQMSLEEYISSGNYASSILPPKYYQNEVAAYRSEITLFPVVSDYYSSKRIAMLWENEILLLYSKNNY